MQCISIGGVIVLIVRGSNLSIILYAYDQFLCILLIGCHYQKGGECWGMVSSLLVLMNEQPCVLTCSMKVKRNILLIRAMDNMLYEEIEPT